MSIQGSDPKRTVEWQLKVVNRSYNNQVPRGTYLRNTIQLYSTPTQ